MQKPNILDSWALLSYFEGQKSGIVMKELLKKTSEADGELFISVVNWGEILYVIHQRYGRAKRVDAERLMEQMPLDVVDADKDLVRQAAEFKAVFGLGYADSFAAALTHMKKGTLWTGDQGFAPLKSQMNIRWLDA